MTNINTFINKNFGLIMMVAAILGLVMPLPEFSVANTIMISLGVIIFTSFFRVDLNKDLFIGDIKSLLIFFIIRFLVFPVAIYFLLQPVAPFYALSFFLLFLMPAAVSSPAFTLMFNGNVSLAIKILVFSSFLSILSIPFISQLVLSQKVVLNGWKMFLTMVYTILIPFLVHLPLRRISKAKNLLSQNTPFITAIGLIIIYIAAISHNREIVLGDPVKVVIYTIISLTGLLAFYLIGYYMMYKNDIEKRISYSVCSGANNIGIGVTITAIYFAGEVNVFFIISQLAWIFALIPMRYFYKWQS